MMAKTFTIENVTLIQRGTDIFNDIYCTIKFAECSAPVKFYAKRDSEDPFRAEMWKRLEAREFGDVAFPPSDYTTHPKTADELAEIWKIERDELLLKSDWTQLPSSTLSPEKKAAWETYRQALRDITKQKGYPYEVLWPTKP